ncbi:MAG TPA: PEP-CTERM sorting domain-containing protein [Pirellulales bacterium]|nr:PEP-CTERM sorting domain-containing protein [Pirellulales bacterium]
MKFLRACLVLTTLALIAAIATRAFADPLPGEVLKFQQLPLNNGLGVTVGGVTYGAGGAPYPGHDELSTAYPNTSLSDFNGTFAADDFSDNYSSPVVHLTWWGSYLNNSNAAPNGGVKQFLISFESDLPAAQNAAGYSEPNQPILTQVVTPGAISAGSGTFTETLINNNNGTSEPLYQYNAELAMPFQEQAGTVYWLKIVALAGLNQQSLQWGWHNRDWGIQDTLASAVPTPGEHVEGTVTTAMIPVWHFQDDAVTGNIDYGVNSAGTFAINSETQMLPMNYQRTPSGSVPIDGQPGIETLSEDLAFQLYTVPEPSTIVLLGLGTLGIGAKLWRRRRVCNA